MQNPRTDASALINTRLRRSATGSAKPADRGGARFLFFYAFVSFVIGILEIIKV
jgi:hypothetical protein